MPEPRLKLFHQKTSPFVRKVCVVAHEVGAAGRIELVPTDPDPPGPELFAVNPLGKIPCLVTEEGERLYDSRVICEYLDARFGGGRLFPREPAARWRALRRQVLADGMADALVLIRYEAFRPEGECSPGWVERQKEKVTRGLAALEAEAAALAGEVTIGQIAIGCALGYLDLRFADWPWRPAHPKLAAWYAAFARRDSMRATDPT